MLFKSLRLPLIFFVISFLGFTNLSSCKKKNIIAKHTERLRISKVNPHLLETASGVPVFLNNYTVWSLISNSTRKDIAEFLIMCNTSKFNMVSAVIPLFFEGKHDSTIYDTPPFVTDSTGVPDPTKPIITSGNDPDIAGEYDCWDHIDYIIDLASENGIYIMLLPTWGSWVSGGYDGNISDGKIIFNTENAYQYGCWLGERYGRKDNLLWMLGGDRSAIYEFKESVYDYREIWRAMAEGLADGANGIDKQDGLADYSNILISYHPRKWASNSSAWFHNDQWLSFNSIQDTPYDQVTSLPHDYNLKPPKPTWLFEGRYEGRSSAWGIRYQAYQTVLAGGFGSTYGSENYAFPTNWREIMKLPGMEQMSHLYTVSREIWSDTQFFKRTPDQKLIAGDQGNTYGDGQYDLSGKILKNPGYSNRITAIRGISGKWAMVYTANGRKITLNLSRLHKGKLNAYWFNPRNGKWRVNDKEYIKPHPFISDLITGSGNHIFTPPDIPGPENDWVLVLK